MSDAHYRGPSLDVRRNFPVALTNRTHQMIAATLYRLGVMGHRMPMRMYGPAPAPRIAPAFAHAAPRPHP